MHLEYLTCSVPTKTSKHVIQYKYICIPCIMVSSLNFFAPLNIRIKLKLINMRSNLLFFNAEILEESDKYIFNFFYKMSKIE